jgi:hypothetical protein
VNDYRRTAIVVGALYILGTVFGVSSAILAGGLAPGDLATISTILPQFTLATLCIILMGLALALMAIFLYPVLRKHNGALAMGMLVFRAPVEAVMYTVGAIGWLILSTLSMLYVAPGANTAILQSVADVVVQVGDKIGNINTIFFITGASFLYVSFYRSRLIPRWLSLWGLIAAVPYLAVDLLSFFHVESTALQFLYGPLAIQEMVMGLWLVIAGFNKDAVKRLDEAL